MSRRGPRPYEDVHADIVAAPEKNRSHEPPLPVTAEYDIAPGEDGVALVEALRAALPGPTADRPVYYEITSAIVHTTDGWVTLAVRRCNKRAPSYEPTGVPHDITIDLEDRMIGGKPPKGIRKAIEDALKAIGPISALEGAA